jgi:subtilisin family serine protease
MTAKKPAPARARRTHAIAARPAAEAAPATPRAADTPEATEATAAAVGIETLQPIRDPAQLDETERRMAAFVGRSFFHLAVPAAARGPARRGPVALREAPPTPPEVAIYRDPVSRRLRLLHRELVLQFRPGLDPRAHRDLLQRHDLTLAPQSRIGADLIVAMPQDPGCRGDALCALARALDAETELLFAAPDFVSQFSRGARRRAAGTPPAQQWHLDLIGATEAWAQTRGKRTVSIAILDDGVDIDHPALRPNLHRRPVPREKRDLYGRDFCVSPRARGHFDPRPKGFDDDHPGFEWNDIHGTPCAGVAAGAGPRAYGLAPKCRLLPVKVFTSLPRAIDEEGDNAFASDSAVAAAIRYAALEAGADILSCSWGGLPSRPLLQAFRDAATDGRGGRGAVIVCAAGNDGVDGVDYPAADPHAIAVGASTDRERRARYSNRSRKLWVVAPSDGGDRGIFTTDVAARGRGFNPGLAANGGLDGLYCNDFGGTSSATPLVAGLCALLLSLDPELKRDEVQRVLAETAVKIGPASAYDAGGHSVQYGHGRIDAARAVARVAGVEAARTRGRTPAKTTAAKKPATKKPAAKKPATKTTTIGKPATIRPATPRRGARARRGGT